MREDFERALAFTLRFEGGYSPHDPADPGGETKYGIAKRSHPNLNIKELTLEDARAIYETEYWEPILGDDLPAPVAIALFDFAVHSGVSRAVSELQRLLGVAASGKASIELVDRLEGQDARQIAVALVDRRVRFLIGLVRTKDSLGRFCLGWMRRTHALVAEIMA